jgi:hypothetical protein
MNNANASNAMAGTFFKKIGKGKPGLVTAKAMQVEIGLNDPMATS